MVDDQGYVHFYFNDHLGSARRVLAENGYMREGYTYWSFGASRKEAVGVNQAYRYTGKPFDDDEGLDLYYYGARYYDPVTGRFLAVDPLANTYPAIGPYVYTLNNPLKYIDPDGTKGAHQLDQGFLACQMWDYASASGVGVSTTSWAGGNPTFKLFLHGQNKRWIYQDRYGTGTAGTEQDVDAFVNGMISDMDYTANECWSEVCKTHSGTGY